MKRLLTLDISRVDAFTGGYENQTVEFRKTNGEDKIPEGELLYYFRETMSYQDWVELGRPLSIQRWLRIPGV